MRVRLVDLSDDVPAGSVDLDRAAAEVLVRAASRSAEEEGVFHHAGERILLAGHRQDLMLGEEPVARREDLEDHVRPSGRVDVLGVVDALTVRAAVMVRHRAGRYRPGDAPATKSVIASSRRASPCEAVIRREAMNAEMPWMVVPNSRVSRPTSRAS
jgi:hypothetical protein